MKARFIIALLICISFFVHLQNSEIADPPGVNFSERVDFSGAGDLGPSWIPPLLERSWYRWISFKDAPITICRSKPSRELDPDRAFVETLVSQVSFIQDEIGRFDPQTPIFVILLDDDEIPDEFEQDGFQAAATSITYPGTKWAGLIIASYSYSKEFGSVSHELFHQRVTQLVESGDLSQRPPLGWEEGLAAYFEHPILRWETYHLLLIDSWKALLSLDQILVNVEPENQIQRNWLRQSSVNRVLHLRYGKGISIKEMLEYDKEEDFPSDAEAFNWVSELVAKERKLQEK